ncbi:Na+/H+ antiporter subunit E [Egicoccus sp. AB-alg6-2]|uniref:Na+/H+ antiporter subunit E n=1 Tax=Egicoccus sp. AB-alg6-2 TaxID=3242692 RepID=UPI00359DD1C6
MRSLRTLVLFVTMLAFWLLLSWRLDPLFLVLGVVSAAVVTWYSLPLLDAVLGAAKTRRHVHVGYLLLYVGWLLTRLPAAGVHIAHIVLDPRVPPRPGVVRFRTNLSSPAARTMLATSITMVPGTMTLDVDGAEFTVHAFTPTAVADLANAATQRRIARIFGDPPDDPPQLRWEEPRLEPPRDPDLSEAP